MGSIAGEYVVTVTDDYGCEQTASVEVEQIEHEIDVSIFYPNHVDSLYAIHGNNTTGMSTTNPTYLWSTGETTSQIVATGAAGEYSVTVTDVNGCSGDATFLITNMQDTAEEVGLEIYPNPTYDSVHINAVKPIDTITIYDALGRIITKIPGTYMNTISLGSQPSGVYIISLMVEGSNITQKIVKK